MIDANARYAEAEAAIAAHDHAAARRLLAEVVTADPRHELAWLMLASVMESFDQTADCLQRVLALNPENDQARDWLAQAARDVAWLAAVAETQAEPGDDQRPVPRLGQYLLDFKFVSAEQLRAALLAQRQARQAGQSQRPGEILLAEGALSEERLNFALREQDRTVFSLSID